MSIDEAGCIENPNDPRCSCYNVIFEDCDAKPDIPGCKEGKEWEKSILDAVPDNPKFGSQKALASREIALRYHCGPDVCGEDKYRPPEYEDYKQLGRCDFKLDLCASDVQVGETINSKYFRDCTLNNVKFSDLDAVYAQDASVQAILGLRTAENASLIAAENKKHKLKLRAQDRRRRAQELADKIAGDNERIKRIEEIGIAREERADAQRNLMLLGLGAGILVVVGILNV